MGHLLQVVLLAAAVLAQPARGHSCKCRRERLETALNYIDKRLTGTHWKDSDYGHIIETLDQSPVSITILGARFEGTSACYHGALAARTTLLLEGVTVALGKGSKGQETIETGSRVSFDVGFNVTDSCKVTQDTLTVRITPKSSLEKPEKGNASTEKALSIIRMFVYELLKEELEQYFEKKK